MRRWLVVGMLAAAGCGGGDDSGGDPVQCYEEKDLPSSTETHEICTAMPRGWDIFCWYGDDPSEELGCIDPSICYRPETGEQIFNCSSARERYDCIKGFIDNPPCCSDLDRIDGYYEPTDCYSP
jgi:hypothetical protein